MVTKMKFFVPLLACLLAPVYQTYGQTCCPNIGCIPNEPQFRALPPPECPDSATFTFYSRNNPGGSPIDLNTIPYQYNPLHRTVILVHGSMERSTASYIPEMKNTFLQTEDANIIVVDWFKLGASIIVPQTASNARGVGQLMGKIIEKLLLLPGASPARFWCVGFSTGAHLCGYIGNAMPVNKKLGKITGLSPAGPGLEDVSDERVGLNPSCAQFVEVYHTDPGVLGTKRKLGHQDNYMTGHEFTIDLNVKSWLNFRAPVCEVLCQHRYAIDFFRSSITQPPECFSSSSHCTDEFNIPGSCSQDFGCWAYAGYYAERSCRRTGIVHFKISPKAPYCTV